MVEWHPVSHHTLALVVPRITSRTQKTIFPPHISRRACQGVSPGKQQALTHFDWAPCFFGGILVGDKHSSTGCLILFLLQLSSSFFLRRPIFANAVLQALLSGIDGESAWSGRATASCNATASAVAGKMFLAFWCGGGPSTTSLNSKTVPHCLQERVAAMCPRDQIYYLLMSQGLLNIHPNTL